MTRYVYTISYTTEDVVVVVVVAPLIPNTMDTSSFWKGHVLEAGSPVGVARGGICHGSRIRWPPLPDRNLSTYIKIEYYDAKET